MEIKDLRDRMKSVTVEGVVTEKTDTREVHSRFGDRTLNVATAIISDETGSIKLTLWNEQINQVQVDDKVKVDNGYVTSFRGEIQLNIGKYGELTVNQAEE